MSKLNIITCAILLIFVPFAHARDTANTEKYEIEMFEMKRAIAELKETVEQQQQMIRSLTMRINYTKEKANGEEKRVGAATTPDLDREIMDALSSDEQVSGVRSQGLGFEGSSISLPMPRGLRSLNPDISAVGDIVYDLSDNSNPLNRAVEGGGDRCSLREFELGFQAAVDPYVKGAAYVGFHGEHADVKECYAQSLSLPRGLHMLRAEAWRILRS